MQSNTPFPRRARSGPAGKSRASATEISKRQPREHRLRWLALCRLNKLFKQPEEMRRRERTPPLCRRPVGIRQGQPDGLCARARGRRREASRPAGLNSALLAGQAMATIRLESQHWRGDQAKIGSIQSAFAPESLTTFLQRRRITPA